MKVGLAALSLVATTGFAIRVADAQIQYTTQERWVEIQAFLPGESPTDRRTAAGFGVFDEVLSGSLSNNEGSAWAYAAQTSSLQATSISATGSADGAAGPPVGTSAGVGRTSFFVAFTLDRSVAYTLDLDILGEFASWSFQGPSLDIDRPLDFAFGDPGVHLDGTLDAGSYAFSIFLESGAAAEGLGSNFDFAFTVVPGPGVWGTLAMTALAVVRRRR